MIEKFVHARLLLSVYSQEGLSVHQTLVHQVGDAIHPSHPLSSPSPAPNPSQHQSPAVRSTVWNTMVTRTQCLYSKTSRPARYVHNRGRQSKKNRTTSVSSESESLLNVYKLCVGWSWRRKLLKSHLRSRIRICHSLT